MRVDVYEHAYAFVYALSWQGMGCDLRGCAMGPKVRQGQPMVFSQLQFLEN